MQAKAINITVKSECFQPIFQVKKFILKQLYEPLYFRECLI